MELSQDISSLPLALSLQFADAYLQYCGWLGILPLKGGYCSPKILSDGEMKIRIN